MSSFLNQKIISVIHILFVAPLLYAIATDQFPRQYKQYLIYLAVSIAIYHLIRLIRLMNFNLTLEGMNGAINDGFHDGAHHIRMFDSSPGYSIPKLVIAKGEKVHWTNVGELQHTVTSDDGIFHSGYLKPGEGFSMTFPVCGEYSYHCMTHSGWMKGVVIVQ